MVDADRSDTSRALVEQVAASPNLSIVARANDLASATRAIRSGEAIAAFYVPANFERDVKAERRPQIVGFYNQQYLTASGIASSGLSGGLSAAAASAAPAAHAAPKPARIGSLAAETIVLANPQTNYAQFLLRSLLPTIVHAVIALAAGYAVGSEFRRRSMRTWLACAGGNPIIALAGELAPLFAIFFLIMLAVPLVLEGFLEIAFKGDVPMIIAAASLFIVAYLALAALLQLLVGAALSTGLGLAGLDRVAGLWLRRRRISDARHELVFLCMAAILPLRWYMAVLFGQGARGLPVSNSAGPFAALAGLTALYVLLALLQLRAVAGRLSHRTVDKIELPADRPGLVGAFAGEWQRVLAIRGAFILLIGAPLLYGNLLSPSLLSIRFCSKLPIVAVDADNSELGRRIVDTLDASGAVSVVARARTLADARAVMDRGDAFAAVGIPPGTERDVLKGITAHIPIYADATYLFVFRSLSSGIAVWDQHAVVGTRRCRRAHRGQPRQGDAGRSEPGRCFVATYFQPGRRLRELHSARSFPIDPPANPADRRGAPHQCRIGTKPRGGICERARARHCTPHYLPACLRALCHRVAPYLWLLGAWRSGAIVRARVCVPAGD